MADERDFELLDDYLTDRMSGQDRSAFEQKLKADPDLQHEYALQQRLIQGIKNARVAELKSMLNNVPIPASGTGNTLGTKIVLGTVATVIIAGAAYWFARDDQSTPSTAQVTTQETVPSTATPQEPEPIKENTKSQSPSSTKDPRVVETDKNQTSAGTEHSKPSLAKRPDPLSAPVAKNSNRPDAADDMDNRVTDSETHFSPAAPSLTVEKGASTQYSFHYQMGDGKVVLFGPFEKNQYQVMEFMIEGKRTAFLYYKDQYYQLQDAGSQTRPLTAVTDQAVLKKLADHHRSR